VALRFPSSYGASVSTPYAIAFSTENINTAKKIFQLPSFVSFFSIRVTAPRNIDIRNQIAIKQIPRMIRETFILFYFFVGYLLVGMILIFFKKSIFLIKNIKVNKHKIIDFLSILEILVFLWWKNNILVEFFNLLKNWLWQLGMM